MEIVILIADKHDLDGVAKLQSLSKSELQVHLAEICEWIQDMNWPVAKHVAVFLVEKAEYSAPQLVKILGSSDIIWKHNVLTYVVAEFDDQTLMPLVPAITEQVEFYDQHEKDEDLLDFMDVAKKLLSRLG